MDWAQSSPLITFALVSYEAEDFIAEAIAGAFSQTYQPLEIILSDDGSDDQTFRIIEEMAAEYRGPHKVILNRNEKNLGLVKHINRIMELSRGEIFVIAAGDDISYMERTQRLYDIFKQGRGKIKSVFSNSVLIDENGEENGLEFKEFIDTKSLSLSEIKYADFGIVTGCSHAWTRDLFSTFGPLRKPLNVEDSVIAFRAALLGQIEYVHEPLVRHRRHGNNTWQYTLRDPISSVRFQFVEKERILGNWLRDINTMALAQRERSHELDELQKVITQRYKDARKELLLFRGSMVKRATFIAQELLNGIPLRTIRHHIGISLVPRLYQRYMLLKYKKNTKMD